jgi:PKD repeat protein
MQSILLSSCLFVASLTTLAQPVITANPQNTTNCIDSCSMIRVAAVGNGLSFQWQGDMGSGFVNLTWASATNDTLMICSDSAMNDVDYRCVVSDNNNNTVMSNVATVSTDSCLAPIADFTFTFEQANVCYTNTSKNASTVIWNFGDGNTDETNNNAPCNDYGTAWYYDVTLYAFNDYGSDQKTVSLDLVGLEELSNAIRVYPNPASSLIFVESTNRIESIQLMDMQGRVLQTTNGTELKQSIDLSAFDAGIYNMLITSEGESMFHKIVKQ